jgi:hypothetical protein
VNARLGAWLMAIGALALSSYAPAQMGPTRARPIAAAAPHKPPLMTIDQKPRKTVVDVTIGTDGRVISAQLVERSGNGIFDERVRGFWIDHRFVPAIAADGTLIEDTLRITNKYSFTPLEHGFRDTAHSERFNYSSSIEGYSPADTSTRLSSMSCRDLLWEYVFMHQVVPKADLSHEELFHVAFAMLIAGGHLSPDTRDALIGQWTALIQQTVTMCRAQPAALYWKESFVPTFVAAVPVNGTVP